MGLHQGIGTNYSRYSVEECIGINKSDTSITGIGTNYSRYFGEEFIGIDKSDTSIKFTSFDWWSASSVVSSVGLPSAASFGIALLPLIVLCRFCCFRRC